MGSSWDHYYDTLEQERWESLRKRGEASGRTPQQQAEYEELVENVRKGRDLYDQRKGEDTLIELFLTHTDLIKK